MVDLLVPVYLNQRTVFDMIAMLQGGFSTVTTVNRQKHDSVSGKVEVGGKFGLSGVLSSLVQADFNAKSDLASGKGSNDSRFENRYHTPASIFYTLRKSLHDSGAIKNLNDFDAVLCGDLIDFEANLKLNPALEYLRGAKNITNTADFLKELSVSSPSSDKRGKGKAPSSGKNRGLSLMDSILQDFEQGGTFDLVSDSHDLPVKAVLTLESDFLNDPSMSDLVDGTFKVLAKVFKRVESPEEGISLIRKTFINSLPESDLKKMQQGLNSIIHNTGFNLPSFTHKIPGPAVQVMPIAIFS
ncbi:DUF6414 family protein [Gilvimarinus xylanilyticus]|uniref:Uncharacterized protein n=1 Tax=Gilvimarinus xylanilyticus TaxID=2944139 RepID=A0A9X2I2C7_9GAMM|nr:hypothetical protein [Gilvimarinus xylanilyticus]MCP8899060.1 hypothetical protein [Gilvimarinus xylanilyticus]